MQRLSLRLRMLAFFSLIMTLMVIIGGGLLIGNAREAVRVETTTSVDFAKSHILAAVRFLDQSNDAIAKLADHPGLLAQSRHVRLHLSGLSGRDSLFLKQTMSPLTPDDMEVPQPPSWFEWLVRPSIEVVRVPLIIQGERAGLALIVPEPAYEISEHWDHARSLSAVMLISYFAIIAVVYWGIGGALRPLAQISEGLEKLQEGEYSIQLRDIRTPDLREIARHFNDLANKLSETIKALDQTIEEKAALNKRLITVQDAERRKIALELHDEFGPCLFGIKANASHLLFHLGEQSDNAPTDFKERIGTIVDIADHMQTQNRALLHRLRPMALDKFGLPHLLEELVSQFKKNHPSTEWTLSLTPSWKSQDESIDLTVYRVVQESLTNVARHAKAKNVTTRLSIINADMNGAKQIEIAIEDDGQGIAADRGTGLGVDGMSERVQGLGGHFTIRLGTDKGTVVRATIPMS